MTVYYAIRRAVVVCAIMSLALPVHAATLAFGGPAPARDVSWTLAGLIPQAGRVSDPVEVDTDGLYHVLCTWALQGPVGEGQTLELYVVTGSDPAPTDSDTGRGAGGALLGSARGPDPSPAPVLTLTAGLRLEAGQALALALWNNTSQPLADSEAEHGCVVQLLE